MPANIETMAYVKRSEADIPWHQLGTPIPDGAASADEIIAAAHLDWQVEARPLFLEDGTAIDNARAIVRDSDNRVFGVVTDAYTPIQNREAFEAVSEWLQDGRLQFETAGALGNGSRVWGLARIGEDFEMTSGDAIRPYAMIYNRHDGHGGLIIKDVTTRVVCANTLGVALAEYGSQVSIWHTSGVAARIKEASQALGLVQKNASGLAERLRQLADLPVSDEQFERVADILAPRAAADATDHQRERAQRQRLAFLNLYQGSPTVDRGTRYGLFNAATEYIDHYQRRNGQNADSKADNWVEARAVYSLDGKGADIRQRVFDTLLRMKPVIA